MNILVTGGAGYIGAVVVEELLASGAKRVVVLDDLSKGHKEAVLSPALFYQGDISDHSLVKGLCQEHQLEAVVHLAASSLVSESVQHPARYYENNVTKGLALLNALVECNVKKLVFSSTAAVYGEPPESPITEDFPTQPTNPYGETKLAFEKILSWYQRAYGLRFVSLRYFNAAGATQRNGEKHSPETHLIPLVLQAAKGELPFLSLFGDDYPTPDGTCIRDYIHVSDLARAHVLALSSLAQVTHKIYNLGCGGGFSVKQVIEAARRVTKKSVPVEIRPRREGDPALLVASSQKITEELGWRPQKTSLEEIIESAWSWMGTKARGS